MNAFSESQDFEAICRRHNLSVTPQRIAVYREFCCAPEHPSANVIFQRVRHYYPNISFDTVNRTLNTLQRIGLATTVECTGEPKRFDPNLEPHHHFHCLECGSIRDFTHSELDQIALPEIFPGPVRVVRTRLHIDGYCEQCRQTQP
jgi:Fur family peroxide stress response transcriptional regulator